MLSRRAECFLLMLFAVILRGGGSFAEIVRGIYCHPGPAVNNRIWGAYGAGYTLSGDAPRSGPKSMHCLNRSDGDAHGGMQEVVFKQDRPRPIVVAGWAKLKGVSGKPGYRCSVYLDLALTDGKPWFCKIAPFDPAVEGWQYVERIYEPPAPVASAKVYVFLRELAGEAWFDDVYVGEILDEQGTRSPNLLRDPGFDDADGIDNRFRDPFFQRLKDANCNAFHFYRSTSWEPLMAQPGLPPVERDDPLLDFVADAHRRGFKVWLTVGAPAPPIRNAASPEFPFYGCVNGRWGEAYTKAVAYFAQYGVDGIGVVPDEWISTNGRVKQRFAKHADPAVAEFYANLPDFCDCGICGKRFEKTFGTPYPDVSKLFTSADPVWAKLVQFRYDSTAAWMQRTVEAAKAVESDIITDTMICVLPVCSDNRIHAGAAWDQIGARTDLDCLQTDPYIFLHNYLGDSTHYYATETAIHLKAANWKRRAGVTLEACRLRATYRPKEPAEVYAAALSCLAHGAREFFWWHMDYLEGKSAYVDPEAPRARVAAAYRVMREMEPYLTDAEPAGDILVLYSRRSEDIWDQLGGSGRLPARFGPEKNAKRGFIAHKHVLYYLLRRGCQFQMTFIENPDPAKLARARVLIVPFPLALNQQEADLLTDLVRQGKTAIVMSELSSLSEYGEPLPEPRLGGLFPGALLDRDQPHPVQAAFGRGAAVFLGGDSAVRLFEPIAAQKDPKTKVRLPAFSRRTAGLLDRLLTRALGRPAGALAAQPAGDAEITVLDGPGGRMLLAVNWESSADVDIAIRRTTIGRRRRAEGFAITADAAVRPLVRELPREGPWRFRLAAQEAWLLRLE